MNNQVPDGFNPLHYDASYEQPSAEEASLIKEIMDTLAEIQHKTYASEGHAIRSVHAKSHALLKGQLQVLDNLPPYLAQGLFAKPGVYNIVIRISTAPGDVLPDSVSTPRGFSFKVSDVEGEHLQDTDEKATQDFILVNGSTVFPKKLKDFLSGMKQFDALTNEAEGLKEGISKVLRAAGTVSEKLGGPDQIMAALGGQPEKHPMGDTYYSQGAFLYGDYMAKFSLTPVSSSLINLTGTEIELDDDAYALRHILQKFFADNGGEWELGVQLSTDIEKMPVEDASVEWPEKESPYLPVAKITIEPQEGWTEEKASVIDDKMYFSVWHGLAAHRPLGAIQRARKPAYKASAAFRRSMYGEADHAD